MMALYIIDGVLKCGDNPLLSALLPGKSEVNYRDMWTSLIASCSARNLQLQVSVIHIDFEKTMHTVLQEIFPAAFICIKCCRFHLGQAWWRKIQNLGLGHEYKDTDSELGKWLSSLLVYTSSMPMT